MERLVVVVAAVNRILTGATFQQVVPGFFYFLGVGNKAKGITAMIHTPEFDVDEDSLVIGVKVMSNVLLDYLERNSRQGAAR